MLETENIQTKHSLYISVCVCVGYCVCSHSSLGFKRGSRQCSENKIVILVDSSVTNMIWIFLQNLAIFAVLKKNPFL